MQTVHYGLVLLCLLIIVLHIRIVLKLIRGFAHDILDPRCEHGVTVADGHHEEHARAKHVVKIFGHERCDELVLLCRQTVRLGTELCVHHIHVAAVHDGTVMGVDKFCLLVLDLAVLVEELEQLVVERRAAHGLLGVVYLYGYVACLKHKRHHALVIHEDVCHANGVKRSVKLKLSMHNIARVETLEIVVLENLQIQHAAIKRRDV